ncbi:T-complex protein 1 subunit beta, partial [Batrachochytrium dendrobatidis]
MKVYNDCLMICSNFGTHSHLYGLGFILDKKIGVNQPKRNENAKILIANTPMDTDKIKIFGARVRVDATGKLAELERAERVCRTDDVSTEAKVDKIKAHGINCFVNRQLIYNWPEQLFADSGIAAIEHADFDGIERLALVTEDRLIKFSGVAAGEACTVVLRGATNQLLDEAERSLARCPAVEDIGAVTPGKQAIAIESFARALRQLPMILADNAGYDSADLVSKLRASHANGKATSGLDMYNGAVADVRALGITESFKLKRQVLLSASEA